MGRKSRERRQAKKQATEQKSDSRSSIKLVIVSVLIVGVVAGLVFGYGWSPIAGVSEQQSDGQTADLPPLSSMGKSIRGWHDMANIPKRVSGYPLAKDRPQPDVVVQPSNRDLGFVGSRDVVNLTYRVVNQGNEDLVIDSVVTSCGCTTGDLSHNTIPPGHRADLKVRFDVGFHKMERGEQVVRIVWLKTNDPDTPIAIARLTATVQ